MELNETIAAIATPAGEGGIGIIRISGPKSLEIADKIWLDQNLKSSSSHKIHLGKTYDEDGVIDKCMASVMLAPKTYTGENTVEFSCHGGTLILERVLQALIKNGARLAEPGEFTKCAFINGKLDLIQAEAVADVIHSSSKSALKSAQEQLEGKLSNTISILHEELSNIRTSVEATLDFPEEELGIDKDKTKKDINQLLLKAKHLSATYSDGKILKDGLKVSILGAPNAGKSSLFNKLMGHNKAIVHHIPGTTRDIIEGDILIDNQRIILKDTAGLRETNDEVEGIGVKLAHETIEWADVFIVVIDSSNILTKDINQRLNNLDSKQTIICLNKCDLNKSQKHTLNFDHKIQTSMTNNIGIDELKSALLKFLPQNTGTGIILTNLRHKTLLDKCVTHLENALTSIQSNDTDDIIAENLKLAQNELGEITGKITSTDILNKIFSQFCIGK